MNNILNNFLLFINKLLLGINKIALCNIYINKIWFIKVNIFL